MMIGFPVNHLGGFVTRPTNREVISAESAQHFPRQSSSSPLTGRRLRPPPLLCPVARGGRLTHAGKSGRIRFERSRVGITRTAETSVDERETESLQFRGTRNE